MKTKIEQFFDALSARLKSDDKRTVRAVNKLTEDPNIAADTIVKHWGSDTQKLHVGLPVTAPNNVNHNDISGND